MQTLGRTTDHNFYLSFEVDVDLTELTEIRFAIRQPGNNKFAYRTLPAADWNTITAGGILEVKMLPSDFTTGGDYKCQLFGREVFEGETVRSLSSEPYEFSMDNPVAPDPWNS